MWREKLLPDSNNWKRKTRTNDASFSPKRRIVLLDNAALAFYTALPAVGSLGRGNQFLVVSARSPEDEKEGRKEAFPPLR